MIYITIHRKLEIEQHSNLTKTVCELNHLHISCGQSHSWH